MRYMPSFRDLSIRRKLTLTVMITTCTAILLACGAFFAFDIHAAPIQDARSRNAGRSSGFQ